VAASVDYKGKTHFFCQEGCKEEFLKDPEKWVKMAAMKSEKHAHEGSAAPS
jgi:YHS domain-containing protein